MTELYCPECDEDWSGDYNTHHQCSDCGTPLRSRPSEDRLEQVLAELWKARIWAGENLPAAKGTTMVMMLEKAMRGGE